MPSSPGYKRDYKQERVTAKKRGETGVGSESKDATRHRDRRKLEKKIGRKLTSDETVDHKKPLKSGGSSSPKNLRVRSYSDNSRDGGKMGNKAGKSKGGKKSKR